MTAPTDAPTGTPADLPAAVTIEDAVQGIQDMYERANHEGKVGLLNAFAVHMVQQINQTAANLGGLVAQATRLIQLSSQHLDPSVAPVPGPPLTPEEEALKAAHDEAVKRHFADGID